METVVEISVNNIDFRYMKEWVLKNVSMKIAGGEFYGIAGPNGSGKTTLLKILDGLLHPLSGDIFYWGRHVQDFSRRELSRIIAYVSQEHELPFAFTVEEAVLMGRYPHLGFLGFEGERDFLIANEAMKTTGVSHLKKRLVTELSGGERQRVVIARALAQEPKIMLLDEPTAHLDISSSVEIMELLKQLQRVKGITIVTASHDLNLLARYTDRLAFLWMGEKIKEGKPEEVLTVELLEKVYGSRFRIICESSSKIPIIVPERL